MRRAEAMGLELSKNLCIQYIFSEDSLMVSMNSMIEGFDGKEEGSTLMTKKLFERKILWNSKER